MINNVDWSIKYNETNTNLPLLDRVLEKRQLNINDLNKTYSDMYDPFLMNDMDIAVMKIDEVRNKIQNCIFTNSYTVLYFSLCLLDSAKGVTVKSIVLSKALTARPVYFSSSSSVISATLLFFLFFCLFNPVFIRRFNKTFFIKTN